MATTKKDESFKTAFSAKILEQIDEFIEEERIKVKELGYELANAQLRVAVIEEKLSGYENMQNRLLFLAYVIKKAEHTINEED